MKINRKHREAAEMSTESMNDIMFFLLLFFLIISTIANPSVLKLNLPNSSSPKIKVMPQVVVEVSADHHYTINNWAIPFTDLENALKFELAKTKSSNIILVFDKTLSIQDLADVMQIGSGLGVKMVLETKSKTY